MIYRVFDGKNWKLASDKKWTDQEISTKETDKLLGTKQFEDDPEIYEVYEQDGKCYAKVGNPDLGPRWVLYWGQLSSVQHSSEEEAKELLIELCNHSKVAGSLASWPKDSNTTTKVFLYSSPNMPKVR